MGFGATHAPTAKFTVGIPVSGTITDARQVQASDWKTRRPEYWEEKAKTYAPFAADGTPNEPKVQLEVTLETGVPDDRGDTERRVFIKNARQFKAFNEAMRAARARRGLLIGGWLAMTCTGTEPGEGSEDAKTWAIEYRPPAEDDGVEVSDTVYLVGGGTWRKGAPAAPEPVMAAPPARPVPDDAPGDLRARTQDAITSLRRAHETSPVLAALGIKVPPPREEEPPF